MKRLFIGSIISISILFLNSITFSYTLTVGEDSAVDKVVEIFQKEIIKNNPKTKDLLVATLNKTITKYKNDEVKYEILRVLTERIDELKLEEQNTENENNSSSQTEIIPENNENTEENNDNQNTETLYKADLQKVRQAWLDWQNEVRQELGLKNYTYNEKLEKTATNWANTLFSRGDLDVNSVHKRDLNDSYYDYNKISNWLKDRDVTCKNVDKWTFSESVVWTSYYCSSNETDCTDEFITGLKKSFDRYMSEKDRTEDSRPHYNAIISDGFKEIGTGFAVKEVKQDYFEVFAVTHYCTEVE